MAVRHDRGIFAGPGLTFGEAVMHGKSGGDTWSYDGRKAARAIARAVYAGKKPIGPEKDKHGKINIATFIHIKNRLLCMHFMEPQLLCVERMDEYE